MIDPHLVPSVPSSTSWGVLREEAFDESLPVIIRRAACEDSLGTG